MRTARVFLLVWFILVAAACASSGSQGLPASQPARSQAGTVAHGELITVPWGTVDDWNIIVAPMQMGAEEPRSEEDNRLLRFRVFATPFDPSSWQVTALYKFGFALDNENIHWVEGSANYMIVPK